MTTLRQPCRVAVANSRGRRDWERFSIKHRIKRVGFVSYPAGGITDILPRIMGEWLTGKWGQPVIVDNRPGAAGNIGAEAAFKAEPDGYTVMVSAPSRQSWICFRDVRRTC